LADGGTLLLDRVGDLPLSAQAKLLHLLDQRSYTPLGSNQPRRCDVRLLATSDIDLAVAVAAGEFRSDLHQRLSAVRVDVPPLRERLDDLELLVQHFLKMADHEHAELPVEPAVLERLRIFSWPGNVRQLRSVVEHAAVVSRGRPLTCDHLPPLETQRHAASMVGGTHGPATTLTAAVGAWTEEACQQEGAMDLLNRFLATVEPTLLETVLKHTDGNRLAAAELLGIHRGTLRDRLRRYGIQP
jgi:two-component system nitrogen regulation response regulator GlnG